MTPSQIRLLQTYKKTLLVFDFLGLTAIFLLIFAVRMSLSYQIALQQPMLLVVGLINIASLYIFGGYDIGLDTSFFERFFRVFLATLSGFGLFIGINYLVRTEISGFFGRGVLVTSFAIFFLYAIGIRTLVGLRLQYLKESRWTWLGFGDHSLLERLIQDTKKNGFLGNLKTLVVEKPDDFKLVLQQLHEPWEGLIIATKVQIPEEISNTFLHHRLNGLQIVSLTQVYEHIWKKLPVHFLENQWLLTTEGFSITHNPIGLRIKRLMDIGFSLLLLLVTWPILILTMMAIKLESTGPIFFRQTRTGKDGKEFSIVKFRSMSVDAEKNGAQWAQKNDSRVTRVGKWIRLTRIDELPQIINVLRGDMSFIGPRPERPEFNQKLEEQIPYYQLRHLLRPGITGWAQVMYPYGASIEDAIEKLQYELYYIKNYTIALDLLIILKTVKIVLFGKGR